MSQYIHGVALIRDIEMRIETTDGRVVELDITVVTGVAKGMRGLIGRPQPAQSSGSLLRSKQVHTFGMRYPIDVLHVARDGTVLNVTNLRPWKLSSVVLRARWVLELRSGEAERLGIRPGSVVMLDESA